MSAIFTPPTSKASTNASFYPSQRNSENDPKEIVIMGHDSAKNLESSYRYMRLARMSDDIANDMHKESLAGMQHDAQGHASFPG